MCDGSVYVRYIHQYPPEGVLENQHYLSDVLLRYSPSQQSLPASLEVLSRPDPTVQEKMNNDQQSFQEKRSDVPVSLITPPWQEKYERSMARRFVPAINYSPDATPLYREKFLL